MWPEPATRARGRVRILWRQTVPAAATATPARRTTVARTARARAVQPLRARRATNATWRGLATRAREHARIQHQRTGRAAATETRARKTTVARTGRARAVQPLPARRAT